MCAAALPAASVRARRSSRSGRQTNGVPATRATRWRLLAGLAALAVLLFWVWGPPPHDGQPAVVAPSTATPDRAPPPLTRTTDGATDSLAQATAAAEARLQASLERLAREDRERADAHAIERAAAQRGPQRPPDPNRRREAAATPARVEPVSPSAGTASVTASAPPVQQTLPDDRTAAVPPAPLPSVEKGCAASGNFFSRSVCQRQACADPALAQDPVCRRLRESEQAGRPDPGLLN